MENEKVFYQNPNVLITQSRIVVHGKTYAMRNISSVALFKESKIFFKISSTIMLGFGLIGLYLQEYLLGIIAIGIAVILLFKVRDEFVVVISSNSGNSNVLSSKNKEYSQSVVDAISEAIVYRG